ncbi:MAG: JDVT-CTERM system glutamic-type intramembrane protease [Thioalkalispiraceae bacterium]|jgi:membrane protease YdiL (CAAX protease family)
MIKIVRDWQFYLCLGLGPLAWWLIAFVYPVRDSFAMPAMPWLQLLMVLLIYPVLEEIVFRGLVLEFVSRHVHARFGLLSGANLLTSVLFVAAHLIYNAWAWALLVFFPSLVFGYLKERHQSLISPVVMHSFYNLGFVWFFWR